MNQDSVTLPTALYTQMANCFYGDGPTFSELSAPSKRTVDIKTPQPSPEPVERVSLERMKALKIQATAPLGTETAGAALEDENG